MRCYAMGWDGMGFRRDGIELNGNEWNGKFYFDMVALSAKAGVHRSALFKILQLTNKKTTVTILLSN